MPKSGSASATISLGEAARCLSAQVAPRFLPVFRHHSLEIELYAPRGSDPQTRHSRDEVYVVVAGSGTFRHQSASTPVVTGDCLFVAAGVEHRFESFSPDFAVWVMFYGPEGGERSVTKPSEAGPEGPPEDSPEESPEESSELAARIR